MGSSKAVILCLPACLIPYGVILHKVDMFVPASALVNGAPKARTVAAIAAEMVSLLVESPTTQALKHKRKRSTSSSFASTQYLLMYREVVRDIDTFCSQYMPISESFSALGSPACAFESKA